MASLLSYALTNVADVKESLGISSGDSSKNNLIIRKINQVTKQIEAYCGRRFLLTTYTNEEYDSTQTNQLILRQRPVVGSITFSERDSSLNEANWSTVESTLYFVDNNAGVVDGLFRNTGGWNRWRVTYSAGYATIPEDLAEAAAMLASYYVLNPDGSQVGVAEKQEGQRRVRYGQTAQSFQNIAEQLGINQIIDSYANMPVITDS